MASIKVKFRESTVAGKRGTIYYQVCHKGKSRQISSKLHIYSQLWSKDDGYLLEGEANASSCSARRKISSDCARLQSIIEELDARGCDYSLDDIVSAYHSPHSTTLILAYIEKQVDETRHANAFGRARSYQRTYKSFSLFLNREDLPLSMLSAGLVSEYSEWLSAKGVVRNTISYYMRTLRAIYNKAVRQGLVAQNMPFAEVYTGIDKTRKRAVDVELIRKICKLDLSKYKSLELYRDLFVFSFCTRGMAFVDMAYLKKDNISVNSISYTRRKTGQRLNVYIEARARRIISKYETSDSPYIFPVISSENEENAYRQYELALIKGNHSLKTIAEMLGVTVQLSFHTARHSWATAARNTNIPLSVISQSMGHTSERTTQIYLESLDNSIIDKANRKVLGMLGGLL